MHKIRVNIFGIRQSVHLLLFKQLHWKIEDVEGNKKGRNHVVYDRMGIKGIGKRNGSRRDWYKTDEKIRIVTLWKDHKNLFARETGPGVES